MKYIEQMKAATLDRAIEILTFQKKHATNPTETVQSIFDVLYEYVNSGNVGSDTEDSVVRKGWSLSRAIHTLDKSAEWYTSNDALELAKSFEALVTDDTPEQEAA